MDFVYADVLLKILRDEARKNFRRGKCMWHVRDSAEHKLKKIIAFDVAGKSFLKWQDAMWNLK